MSYYITTNDSWHSKQLRNAKHKKLLCEHYLQRGLFKTLICVTKIIYIIQVQETINNCDKLRADGYAEERVANAGGKAQSLK